MPDQTLSRLYLDLMRLDYRQRLHAAAVPVDPAKRTPEQTTLAASLFWGAATVAQLSIDVTQAALEG